MGLVERDFQQSFRQLAVRVHRRRVLRRTLSYAAIGLAAGALAAGGLWALRLGAWRPFSTLLGVLGALVGGALGVHRRWSDGDMALYLDARLGSNELLTTALNARSASVGDPSFALVVERAAQVLDEADPAHVETRLWTLVHGLLPASAAAIVAISLAPLPKPRPIVGDGASPERVQTDHLPGLERIAALGNLRGRTPAQDARLKALSDQARRLQETLAQGLSKRQALSEIEKLRDGIAAERLRLRDPQNRFGLDAALLAFSHHPSLRDAQNALGNGDLTAFDEAMQKLANQAETSARAAAKSALEEAEKAARKRGGESLGDALEAERRAFGARESRASAVRDLARALDSKLKAETREDLKEFERSLDPRVERRLTDALERALDALTPEERQRLQERLQKQLAQGEGGSPLTQKQLAALAQKLSHADSVEALKKELRELAESEPSDESERDRALEDADRGGSAAERSLGSAQIPLASEASRSNGSAEQSNASRGPLALPGKAVGGEHAGSTPSVSGREMRAKAEAPMQAGAPMQGATLGRAPARAGETANQRGTGSLGSAQRTEVDAVDHADIPEEYREQVGRYFEP